MTARGNTRQLDDASPLLLDDAVAAPSRLIARSFRNLGEVETHWRALEAKSPADAVFLSFDQVAIWARHFVSGTRKGRELLIVRVMDGDRPVMIVPLAVRRRAGLRIARIAGDPIAQYDELLADPASDLEKSFAAVVNELRRQSVDLIVFERVRDDSLLNWSASALLRPTQVRRVAPFIDLTAWGSHEEFVRSRSKNLVKSLRNRRNQLEKSGTISFACYRSGPKAREAMATALDLKREWLAERGAMSSAFADPATYGCLLDMAEHAPQAVVMRMNINDEPAAVRLGFVHGSTFFSYLSAYDPRFSQFSPGKLLMARSISDVRDMGMTHLDMLPPAGEHKDIWCDTQAGTSDYLLPLGWRGEAFSVAYSRLRPIAKAAWLRLPTFLRTALTINLLAL